VAVSLAFVYLLLTPAERETQHRYTGCTDLLQKGLSAQNRSLACLSRTVLFYEFLELQVIPQPLNRAIPPQFFIDRALPQPSKRRNQGPTGPTFDIKQVQRKWCPDLHCKILPADSFAGDRVVFAPTLSPGHLSREHFSGIKGKGQRSTSLQRTSLPSIQNVSHHRQTGTLSTIDIPETIGVVND